MLTIIHGADFHLDAPFAALPPDKARARRAEQRELLDRLAGLAEERRADVVLLSGDLLDGGQTYQETVQAISFPPWRWRGWSCPASTAWCTARPLPPPRPTALP